MDTRNVLQSRWRARGAVKPLFIAILVVFVLFAVGAWFLIIKPYQAQLQADSAGRPAVPAATQAEAKPPADVGAMDIDQLLSEARKALNDQRYLAPAGNNAFEFYLRVLQKQPGNQVASDALRETFPFASNSAEQAINSSNFSDAQRQIDLLAKADPNNFTLTILRSKLDAQRKLLDKQQQQALDQQKAQELAAQKAAANKVADAQAAARAAQQEQAALAALQAQQARQKARPAVHSTADSPVPSVNQAGAAGGENREAMLISQVPPKYPPEALRSQRSGSVVVGFTVETDGSTGDVHVVSAQPRHLFDRAAVDAVKRYKFKPAMKNGSAVESKRRQRIEFKL